ncbi:MAG: phage minor head protein, partial [Pseudomonadota bacterium]|nr:phage minor head protein [Pseudomonadota bacterium]
MLEVKRRGRLVSARREVAEQNRIRGSYERRLRVQLSALFDSLAVDAGRAYGVGGQPNLFLGTVTNRVAEVLVPHYRSVILAMADRFRTVKIKQDFEQIIRSYLQANAAERIQGIANTTRNQIRKAVLDASADGLGQVDTAKIIQDRVGGAVGRRRANLIARTETHAAASFANHETAKSFGVPMRKQWVATNDGRTRSWHSNVNGQTVDMDEDFIVPYKGVEYRMKHTGDPNGGPHNNINCRCVTIYLEPDDVVTDDLPKEPPPPKPIGREVSLERVLDDLGDDEAIALATGVSRFDRDYRGPKHLGYLYGRQKYDELPEVVSTAEFDAIDSTIYYRGISGVDGDDLKHAEAFKRGDYFVGEGVYGNGTYTAFGDDALDVANKYARGGVVLRMKLPSNAKVIDYKELEQRIRSAALDETEGELGAYKLQIERRLDDINQRLANGTISAEEHELRF